MVRKAILFTMAVGLMGTVQADLQNVQTGGLIEFRGRWIHNTSNEGKVSVPHNGFPSQYAWDDTNDWTFVE